MKGLESDPAGRVVGEFGIGTNRGAKICKNMLEAEKKTIIRNGVFLLK